MPRLLRGAVGLGVAAGVATLGWGLFEAGWLRRRELEVALDGLDPALDGVRIAHLSDFHLGPPSPGIRAIEEAVTWVAARRPDLVCVTGDLLSRPSGEGRLRCLLDRLTDRAPVFVVLGNHDVGRTRDPFSRGGRGAGGLGAARVLLDEVEELELRGCRVQVAGVDPATYRTGESRPWERVDPGADLRLLLCHYPGVMRRLPEGTFDLVLSGHLHAGQIVLPYPGGRLPFAHPKARELAGLYQHPGGVLHVSPGVGTTFVPIRLFARPEVTELVVRSGSWTGTPSSPPR